MTAPPPLAGALALDLAGQTVQLLPAKALWWPHAATLFVADAHIGKAATYRAHGVPVPEATTADTLGRLSALLTELPVEKLVLLGDLLHAAEAHRPAVSAPLHAWRARHTRVAMQLVRGNHDSRAGDPPPSLGIEVVDEPLDLAPLAACHHPQRLAGTTVLAGHWHPVVHLRGRGRDGLRLPAFWHAPGLLVLPAFGAFTGGQALPHDAAARLYGVGGGRVWAL